MDKDKKEGQETIEVVNEELFDDPIKLNTIEKEVETGKRYYYSVNTKKNYIIYQPEFGIEQESDTAYSIKYNELLINTNLPTQKQMLDTLNKKGIWTEENEKEIKELNDKIYSIMSDRISLQNKKGKEKKIAELKQQERETYEEIIKKTIHKSNILSNTIEGLATIERHKYKLIRCVKEIDKDMNETPVWKSVNDLEKDINKDFIQEILNQSVIFWSGVDDRFLELYAEQQSGESDGESQGIQE